MRERMIEDWIFETQFMVRGREGEKGVLATSEFVDRGLCHAAECKGASFSWHSQLRAGTAGSVLGSPPRESPERTCAVR